MTAKEYLSQVLNIDERMASINRDIDAERRKLTNALRATDYSKDKIQNSNQSDISDIIVKIEEYTARRNAEWDRLLTIKQEVLATIDKVQDNTLHNLLVER